MVGIIGLACSMAVPSHPVEVRNWVVF